MIENYKSYVFYDDTDCGGIVYHSNYIKFCERARSFAFFQNSLIPQNEDYFVVKKIEANFISPLILGDVYEVITELDSMKNTSLILNQTIYKISSVNKNENIVPMKVFNSRVLMVFLDKNSKKPKKIDSSFVEIIKKIEK